MLIADLIAVSVDAQFAIHHLTNGVDLENTIFMT
jgi:hypothetical protein